MSTATQSGTRRRIFGRFTPQEPTTAGRRRWRWIAGSLGALVLLVWMLPMIVAHSPLLGWIVGIATGDLNGEVRIHSASLGWFSPIELEGVELTDEQQQPVVSVARVSGDRSLLGILTDLARPGRFRIEQPNVHLVLRPDGSNLEDALAAYLEPSDEPSSGGVDLGLEIVDGTISITDATSQQKWQIERLQLVLNIAADPAKPLELETSGTTVDPARPGHFSIGMKIQTGSEADSDAPPAGGELALRADALPLGMFQALLDRFAADTRLDGRLTASLQCQWSGADAIDRVAVDGSVTAEGLTLATGSLGNDRVALRQFKTICRADWRGDKIQIERAVMDCDVGYLSMVGTLDLRSEATDDFFAALAHQAYEMEGRVDLAGLARMLPNTLHIQQGTQITSGRLQMAMAARPGADGMTWSGQLEAHELAAVNNGRQLVWQQPILLNLAAHETAEGPVVESLRCQSSFLQLDAAGTPRQLSATAAFDLDQLAGQLAGIVDLEGIQMAGAGTARFNWNRPDGQQFTADGLVKVQDLRLTIPSQQIALRENVTAEWNAAGSTNFASENRLDTARLTATVGEDRIEAQLLQPVLDFTGGGTFALDVKAEGQLAHWLPRLRPWISLDEYRPAGSYLLTLQGTGSSELIDIRTAQLTLQQFHVQYDTIQVDEPSLQLTAAGRFSPTTGRLDLKQASLSGANLVVEADNVAYAPEGETAATLSAAVRYRLGIDRFQQWFGASDAKTPGYRVVGNLAGTAQVHRSGDLMTGGVNATVTNLVATLPSGERIVRPEVQLVADGHYDIRSGVVQLGAARLSTDGLALGANGRMETAAEQTTMQVAGQLDYDLDRLASLLQPFVGNSLQISGRGSQPLGYRGPLDPAVGQGEAGIGWASVAAYGFRGGPATVRATLSKGLLAAQPIEMELNEGRVTLATSLRVAPGPMELYVQPGSAARQIRIDPVMCAGALKFINPILAGVTSAEGRFSIELDECRIPLSDPAKSAVKGRFVVHSVEVGPGPLVRELAILLGRESPAKLRKESVVPFQMVNGRIYHEGLELIFPELTIRTHGSVGLDHTLLLMAEMPVPPKWLEGNARVATALKDQTIRLPINGTLEKPQIDKRTLDQLSRQFVQKAAENVIKDEVKTQLEKHWDKIFGPLK